MILAQRRARLNSPGLPLAFLMGVLILQAQPARSTFPGFQSIPSHLYQHWKACGTRIEKPGAERITGLGTIVRRSVPTSSLSAPAGISLVLEFPGRARVEESGKGVSTHDIDGKANSAHAEDVEDLLEVLLEDFSDGFFRALVAGGKSRWIGENFRSGDAGPEYLDIAEITYQTKVRGSAVVQTKRYYLDSITKLLAKVVYRQTKKSGAVVTVESEFGDWTTVSGQAVPRVLVRREDGVEMLRIRLSQVGISAAANDGVFGGGNQ